MVRHLSGKINKRLYGTMRWVFLEECLKEFTKGNKPTTSFNKDGWLNLEKNVSQRTKRTLNKKQLSNKWETLKGDWKRYEGLTRFETGLGGTRNPIEASPEWWDEKIKEDKEYAKFRDADLEIYELIYAPLFRGCVAVGDQTLAPSQFQNNSNPDYVSAPNSNQEGKGDSDEINLGDDDETLFPRFPESSYTKKRSVRIMPILVQPRVKWQILRKN